MTSATVWIVTGVDAHNTDILGVFASEKLAIEFNQKRFDLEIADEVESYAYIGINEHKVNGLGEFKFD